MYLIENVIPISDDIGSASRERFPEAAKKKRTAVVSRGEVLKFWAGRGTGDNIVFKLLKIVDNLINYYF